jgi:hypothetical protein
MTLFCVHFVLDQPHTGFVRAGLMDRPSRKKSHPAGSLSFSQPGVPVVLGQPLNLRPQWLEIEYYEGYLNYDGFCDSVHTYVFPCLPTIFTLWLCLFSRTRLREVCKQLRQFVYTHVHSSLGITYTTLSILQSGGVSGDLGHAFLTINHKVMG